MKINLDIKDLFIIVLSFFLIISFIFGFKKESDIDYRKQQIELLKKENERLFSVNDSLSMANIEIDYKIGELECLIEDYQIQLSETELQLDKLLKRRHEIPIYVNNLSANDVADEFSKYIGRNKGNTNGNN
jgi:hypothetical protein